MEQKEKDEKEKFDKALEDFKRKSLKITNCEEEKTRFMKLAKGEFKNQYNMTLKWLLDFRDGILSHPNQQLSDRIDLIAEENAQLKVQLAKASKEPEEFDMAASGKKIKRRK